MTVSAVIGRLRRRFVTHGIQDIVHGDNNPLFNSVIRVFHFWHNLWISIVINSQEFSKGLGNYCYYYTYLFIYFFQSPNTDKENCLPIKILSLPYMIGEIH